MKLGNIGMAIGLAATAAGSAAQAHDHHRGDADGRHAPARMQAVPVAAAPGEPGHGWQYFTEARQHRAVVISPTGEYFLSHGEGLQRVVPPPPRR